MHSKPLKPVPGAGVETRLTRYGNSLGVRLPAKMAKNIGLRDGDTVVIREGERCLTIVPTRRRDGSLEEMVSRITDDNRHERFDWGRPIGKELW